MKILREFYEKENVTILRNYFYTKQTIEELEKMNDKSLVKKYSKETLEDLQLYLKELVNQLNENSKYIYNHSNDKKLTR